jgi:protein AroM
MSRKRIGALLIGQSPRPDLVDPLSQLLPELEILQGGALDGLTLEDLPDSAMGAYPLVTKMNDGMLVMLEEAFIAPKLQKALTRLENSGVIATILMCAGTFSNLRGSRPLFKPFSIGCDWLATLRIKTIGLISPVLEQEEPIRERWLSLGYETVVWTADLGNQDSGFKQGLDERIKTDRLECIVLDYVGHPPAQVLELQKSIAIPVIDLGSITMRVLASTLY